MPTNLDSLLVAQSIYLRGVVIQNKSRAAEMRETRAIAISLICSPLSPAALDNSVPVLVMSVCLSVND
jgi:hypothetical protein